MDGERTFQIEGCGKFTENEFWETMSALDARKWQNLLPPQLPLEDLPSKREKSFVAPIDAPVPDCLTCGACCSFLFAVGVKPTDKTPPEAFWDVTDESGKFVVDRYMRRDAETLCCSALETTADAKKICRVYEERPRTCRNFEAGSDKCRALRRIYGFEPFLTLEEMYNALQTLKAKESEAISLETIRDAKIVERAETGNLEIVAVMQDGTRRTIHVFDPKRESWMQFQFCGITLTDARRLIEFRNDTAKID